MTFQEFQSTGGGDDSPKIEQLAHAWLRFVKEKEPRRLTLALLMCFKRVSAVHGDYGGAPMETE